MIDLTQSAEQRRRTTMSDCETMNFDDLPADVQEKLNNTPDGEYCRFVLEDRMGLFTNTS
jgi:hypothetical protein